MTRKKSKIRVPNAFKSGRCVGYNTGRCVAPIVADLIVQFKHCAPSLREADELPLCIHHSRDEAFLSWLHRLVQRIVIGTVKALRPPDSDKMFILYKVVRREPCVSFLESEAMSRLLESHAELSGRLGKSVVASSWRGHQYFRRYAVPSNPRTRLQREYREVFSRAVKSWRGLTDAQRESYNKMAEGQPLTGFNVFVRERMLDAQKEKELEKPVPAE